MFFGKVKPGERCKQSFGKTTKGALAQPAAPALSRTSLLIDTCSHCCSFWKQPHRALASSEVRICFYCLSTSGRGCFIVVALGHVLLRTQQAQCRAMRAFTQGNSLLNLHARSNVSQGWACLQ